MSNLQLEIINEADITPGLDQILRDLLCHNFPQTKDCYVHTRAWNYCTPAWNVLLRDRSGRIIGHAALVDRTVRAGENDVRIIGPQNVFVIPEYRGRRLVKRILGAAMEHAGEDYEVGLLCCRRPFEGIYERCGWWTLPNRPIVRRDENDNDVSFPDNKILMAYPLAIKEFPSGSVHLNGNDW